MKKLINQLAKAAAIEHQRKSKTVLVIPPSGKVFAQNELKNLIEALPEGWWTVGKWTAELEDGLRQIL